MRELGSSTFKTGLKSEFGSVEPGQSAGNRQEGTDKYDLAQLAAEFVEHAVDLVLSTLHPGTADELMYRKAV
jgi:hypothetical protein